MFRVPINRYLVSSWSRIEKQTFGENIGKYPNNVRKICLKHDNILGR